MYIFKGEKTFSISDISLLSADDIPPLFAALQQNKYFEKIIITDNINGEKNVFIITLKGNDILFPALCISITIYQISHMQHFLTFIFK